MSKSTSPETDFEKGFQQGYVSSIRFTSGAIQRSPLKRKLTSAPPVAKKRQKYSVFIYSEAAPDTMFAIYKHTRKFRDLQYLIMGER